MGRVSCDRGWPELTEEAKAKLRNPNGKKLCVLLTTGAMNPPHFGHIMMMSAAKKHLEKDLEQEPGGGYDVIASYISPSHALYLEWKNKSSDGFFADAEVVSRPEMCAKLLSDSATWRLLGNRRGWLQIAKWECDAGHTNWPEEKDVMQSLNDFLELRHGAAAMQNVHIMYVCGSDHANECRGLHIKPQGGQCYRPFANKDLNRKGDCKRGIVVVVRHGDEPIGTASHEDLVFCVEPGKAPYSSTIIRSLLDSKCDEKRERLDKMVGPVLSEYLLRNKMYQKLYSCANHCGYKGDSDNVAAHEALCSHVANDVNKRKKFVCAFGCGWAGDLQGMVTHEELCREQTAGAAAGRRRENARDSASKSNEAWRRDTAEPEEDEGVTFDVANNMVLFHSGWPSQWWMASFRDDRGRVFNCAEQFMMFRKAQHFKDKDSMGQVMLAKHPSEQKEIGRGVINFNVREWAKVSDSVVEEGNYYKFSQNASLRAKLHGTGDLTLVEASPHDSIWGIGLSMDDSRSRVRQKWKGQNKLGKVLMSVRQRLREEEKRGGKC